MINKQKIAFIGAGSMAEALIAGMLKEKLYTPDQITVTNRSNKDRLQYLHRTYKVNVTNDKKKLIHSADIIILAIKPKDIEESLSPVSYLMNEQQLLISVLAGVSTLTITDILSKNIPVVRVMPNTSASIGMSATALSLGQYANRQHLQTVRTLFETVGIVTVVNEDDLHAVTGLSGSGPAYVYYLVEAMEKAANEIGLNKNLAKELILQTIIGAAEMLKSSSKHPSILRKEITSPGGTTEAGIEVLEEYQYQEAMIACIKRATERSSELGAALTELIANES